MVQVCGEAPTPQGQSGEVSELSGPARRPDKVLDPITLAKAVPLATTCSQPHSVVSSRETAPSHWQANHILQVTLPPRQLSRGAEAPIDRPARTGGEPIMVAANCSFQSHPPKLKKPPCGRLGAGVKAGVLDRLVGQETGSNNHAKRLKQLP
ncbi:hypothetical protein AVEN_22748-1 [Araneus ventricosus]|uniref:Uncharacterized protein n=1 Tax=Araneus ventricosus TaxID=182803 RepID=A0A4Y2VP37_ARAVE|nr:hypothetical protein AVEN_22748-1 [Araneus ventricosus]